MLTLVLEQVFIGALDQIVYGLSTPVGIRVGVDPRADVCVQVSDLVHDIVKVQIPELIADSAIELYERSLYVDTV